MNPELLVGVDIGTQGTKVAIFTAQGKCLARAFTPSRLRRRIPNVVEEDPEEQLGSVISGIASCMRDAKLSPDSVAGIAIAGQMAGVIGIDADGRHVTPYDSWLDTRCAAEIQVMKDQAGREITRRTGGPPSFNHGPKVLWWKKRQPAVYRKIASFVQPGGYAAMRLCGLKADEAFIDTTYLHFSGFADSKREVWDDLLCREFDVDPAKLPRIVKPHSIVGGLTKSLARRCGVNAGTPVIAGCGDTAASFLACGATKEGICVDVAGTASVFAATTRRFLPDLKNQTLSCGHSATPGLWHPYAYINGGGMNLEWFSKDVSPGLDFTQLNDLAGQVSPSDDLPMFVPHLGGRVSPSWPDLRGAWAGLSWSHGKGALYRAVLEGVALEYGLYHSVLTKLDPSFKLRSLRVTGGGERSKIWNRIKASVLESTVTQIEGSEGAPAGAALLAGFGSGLLPDLNKAANQWIKLGETSKATRAEINFSRKRLVRYRALLPLLNTWNKS